MNKNLLFATVILSIISSNGYCGSFSQRWGANSHITNLPLFFQKQVYNDRSLNDQTTTINTDTGLKTQKCKNCTTVKTIKYSKMSRKKALRKQQTLAHEQTKLRNKIADIEKEKNKLAMIS